MSAAMFIEVLGAVFYLFIFLYQIFLYFNFYWNKVDILYHIGFRGTLLAACHFGTVLN